MKFVPTERPERAYGNKQRLVLEFLNMNVDCVKVEELGESKAAYLFSSAFNKAAEKMNAACHARVINGTCYIFANEINGTEKE